jgi:succinate dehydrogenase flavin-adding protein (antitoxin of CptAB toxin-antitoxin module)
MDLSNEDNLRLNVLLAQPLQAIRINEATMTVYALTEKGEARVQLNPTARDDQYLRWVRELLSMKVTGSPGGYPVFMKRWTRMGHADNTQEHMLLLGEPEAVVAVVYSANVSHEMARRCWWANPTIEVARRLLEYPEVYNGALGKELAEYLMEFLPFEELQLNVVNMVRLCLQGDLISDKQCQSLWNRARRKNPYYVGFLHTDPANIPVEKTDHPAYSDIKQALMPLLEKNNPVAEMLINILSKDGQKWLLTLKSALKKPVDQDVVISLFIAIERYFTLTFPEQRGVRELDQAIKRADSLCNSPEKCTDELKQVLEILDKDHIPLLAAALTLAQLGEDTLIPAFAGNDSVGTVMRRRLEPLTTPLLERVATLMS